MRIDQYETSTIENETLFPAAFGNQTKNVRGTDLKNFTNETACAAVESYVAQHNEELRGAQGPKGDTGAKGATEPQGPSGSPWGGGTFTGTLAISQNGATSSFHNAADALCIDTRDIRYVKIFCREQVFMQHGPDQGWAWAGCSAGGFFTQSSKRYKDNISDMTDEMAKKILAVNVVTFDYKENIRIESERYGHSGVLAEPTDEIIPEVVMHQEIDGEMVPDSVDYAKFTPYLIKMVQMQQKEIDGLKSENATLSKRLDAIEEMLKIMSHTNQESKMMGA